MNRRRLDLRLPGRFVLVVLLVTGCNGEYRSDAPVAVPTDTAPRPTASDAGSSASASDTLGLDLTASVLTWQGTKLWGRGRHTGLVPLKAGYLVLRDARLIGGSVTVDMTSIGITDIPPDQPEPIALLTEHLEDPLFFDVERYPEARFVITDVGAAHLAGSPKGTRGATANDAPLLPNPAASWTVGGNLTIKGVTRHITVGVDVIPTASNGRTSRRYHTRFRINRFRWEVAYRGDFGASPFGASRFAARNFWTNTSN